MLFCISAILLKFIGALIYIRKCIILYKLLNAFITMCTVILGNLMIVWSMIAALMMAKLYNDNFYYRYIAASIYV